ncbi:conserved hypothetical protein [Culex quinquefasciatus]|uniref:BZIP domain-containing protein n=1 Tax=Culex quinquefasciatus TaxID=7176 RepID=B0WRA9_CULQU|nr:conserved hypothetical protein [Culex quinquefasciatus]|eukprot:XP_001851243.1 conserved hypothetical protein [Culex quinquefasciatus]
MARKFPGAENRTPEQQAVRQRNTVAARQSRAKMRIMEEMLTQEATDERTINEYMKERIGACFMYGNALRDVLQLEEADFWAEFQLVKDEYIAEPLRSLHVVPRTISDGSCSDYQDYSEDDEGEEEEEEDEGQQPGTSADTPPCTHLWTTGCQLGFACIRDNKHSVRHGSGFPSVVVTCS